ISKGHVTSHTIAQILRNAVRLNKIEREREAAVYEKKISEERLAVAQRIAKIGNWEMDIHTGNMYWSDEIFNILGLVPGEVSPAVETAVPFAHPEDKELIFQTIREALLGKLFNVDFRIVTRSGIKYANAQGYALTGSEQSA